MRWPWQHPLVDQVVKLLDEGSWDYKGDAFVHSSGLKLRKIGSTYWWLFAGDAMLDLDLCWGASKTIGQAVIRMVLRQAADTTIDQAIARVNGEGVITGARS